MRKWEVEDRPDRFVLGPSREWGIMGRERFLVYQNQWAYAVTWWTGSVSRTWVVPTAARAKRAAQSMLFSEEHAGDA